MYIMVEVIIIAEALDQIRAEVHILDVLHAEVLGFVSRVAVEAALIKTRAIIQDLVTKVGFHVVAAMEINVASCVMEPVDIESDIK